MKDHRKKAVSDNLEPMKSKREYIKAVNDEKHNEMLQQVGPELDKFENKIYASTKNRERAIKE